MNKRYLIVLPTYNQDNSLQEIIREVKRYNLDILVVDDGSTDRTQEILTRFKDIYKIRHHENLGYGKALIDSFQFGIDNNYDYIITMDTDGQHSPGEILYFVEAILLYDIVSGSRYLDKTIAITDAPFERYAINKEITSIINNITRYQITDAFCGFKAYTVDSLRRLRLTEPGYGMPLQVWIQAWKLGLQVKEIPVKLIYKDLSKRFRNSLNNPKARLAYYKSIIAKELGSDAE